MSMMSKLSNLWRDTLAVSAHRNRPYSILSFATALTAVALIAAPAQAVMISKTDNTFSRVDDDFDSRMFDFVAADFAGTNGIIDKVTVQVHFAKCDQEVDANGCSA